MVAQILKRIAGVRMGHSLEEGYKSQPEGGTVWSAVIDTSEIGVTHRSWDAVHIYGAGHDTADVEANCSPMEECPLAPNCTMMSARMEIECCMFHE